MKGGLDSTEMKVGSVNPRGKTATHPVGPLEGLLGTIPAKLSPEGERAHLVCRSFSAAITV